MSPQLIQTELLLVKQHYAKAATKAATNTAAKTRLGSREAVR